MPGCVCAPVLGSRLPRSLNRAAASADFKSLGPPVLGFRRKAVGVERRLHLEVQKPGRLCKTRFDVDACRAEFSDLRLGRVRRARARLSGADGPRDRAGMIVGARRRSVRSVRATRSECAPEASREGRRAAADEQHRDWFTTCAPSSMDTLRDARLPADAQDRTPATSAGQMRICRSPDESGADLHQYQEADGCPCNISNRAAQHVATARRIAALSGGTAKTATASSGLGNAATYHPAAGGRVPSCRSPRRRTCRERPGAALRDASSR